MRKPGLTEVKETCHRIPQDSKIHLSIPVFYFASPKSGYKGNPVHKYLQRLVNTVSIIPPLAL